MTHTQSSSHAPMERLGLTRRWPRPREIEIDDGQLRYRFGERSESTKWDFGFVQDFIALADIPSVQFASSVLAYARRWGVLELCAAHHAPSSHRPELYSHSVSGSPTSVICIPASAAKRNRPDPSSNVRELRERGFRSEPLSGWRFWSGQANRLLRAVAADQEGRELPREDWVRLTAMGPREAPSLGPFARCRVTVVTPFNSSRTA